MALGLFSEDAGETLDIRFANRELNDAGWLIINLNGFVR